MDAEPDPLRRFQAWFAAAGEATPAPEAVALATSSVDGRPSVRMVLLKSADGRGFAFFTNYESRKGGELAANPRAALLFHWPALGRQVRIEGAVERVPEGESEVYFSTRPLESRLAAWASPQSRPIEDRAELERRVEAARLRFPDESVPRPEHWGGFRVVPDAYEFWEHGEHRLHDRLRYTAGPDGWDVVRLAP